MGNPRGSWCATKVLPSGFPASLKFGTCSAECSDEDAYTCSFVTGDGTGGTDEKISSILSGIECVAACVDKKKQDNRINGVTIRNGRPGCWCEKSMSGVATGSSAFRTCFLTAVTQGDEDQNGAEEPVNLVP